MHYILMFGVMIILPIPSLFVLLWVDEQVTSNQRLSWLKILSRSSQEASCALDHILLPNNIHVNHGDMFRLIWWNLIGYHSCVYHTPYKQMNNLLVLLLSCPVFGINIISKLWPFFIIIARLFIVHVHDKIIVLIET